MDYPVIDSCRVLEEPVRVIPANSSVACDAYHEGKLMTTELWQKSAHDLAAAIRGKDVSATEVLEAHLGRIAATNPTINAIVTLSEDIALAQAKAVDEAVAAGERLGPIAGVPVGIKDTTDTAGIRTTYGSPLFADNVPQRDDIMVARLKQAGGIIVGKTNNPEFATGGNTYNDVFGATLNPWDTNLSAGGSTGGGAAGLASGMFPIASGSDLAGSLRIPAAFCGVMGLRPTVGLVPSGPSNIPFDSLGVSGPMARTAEDLAIFLEIISQPHPSDPFCQQSRFKASERSQDGHLRIAYVRDVCGIDVETGVAKACREAVQTLHTAGHTVEELALDFRDGRESFLTLRAQWMVTKNLGLLDRIDELGENLAGNIRAGLEQKPTDIARAEAIRNRLWKQLVEVFETYDVIATPTLPIPPFPVTLNYPESINGQKMANYIEWVGPSLVFSLFGVPALSVPAGLVDGLPAGLQLVGPRFSEDKLIFLADQVAQRRPIPLADLG